MATGEDLGNSVGCEQLRGAGVTLGGSPPSTLAQTLMSCRNQTPMDMLPVSDESTRQ